jgi:hypothetical protein
VYLVDQPLPQRLLDDRRPATDVDVPVAGCDPGPVDGG